MSAADKERNANREREKGNEAYKAGDFKEAYEYYTRSISLFPTAAAYNNRAITAIKLSRFSDAVSDCNVALKLEPTNTKALLRRANAYKSLKKNAEAIADLQSVLKLEPSNDAAKSELEAFLKEVGGAKSDATAGGSRQDSGKGFRVPVQEVKDSSDSGKGSGRSRDTPTQAPPPSGPAPPPSGPAPPNPLLEEPPPPPLPPRVQKLKEEGNAYFKAGQYVDAEIKYSAALTELEKAGKEHEPSVALLLSNRAACLLKNGDSQRCIEDCTRSLALSPLSVKTILRRATAYDSLEKYARAYNDYQLALKVDSSIELAAIATARLGRLLATQYGDEWKSKLPSHPETDIAMAVLSARRAQFAEAEENKLQAGQGTGAQQPTNGIKSNATGPQASSQFNAGVKPNASGAQPNMSGAQPNMSGAQPNMSGAQPNMFGAQPNMFGAQPKTSGAQPNTSGAHSSTSAPKMDTAASKQGTQTTPITMQAPPTTTQAPPPLPPKVNKLKEEGNAFFKAGQYGYAEQKYTQALQELVGKEQSENIALLLSNRAACYLKDGSLAKCVEDCTRSLSLSPLNVKTVIRRAQAYDSMEKYQQAYNDFQLALKIDSTVELAATSSDRLARHLKDKHGDGWKAKLPPNPEADLAMAALRNASSGTSQQGSKEALYDWSRESGNAHAKKDEYLEALECYTTCIQLCPDVAVAYMNRALCHLKLMNPKKAEEDCSKALSIEPSNVKALYRRAMARKALLQYSGCLCDLKAVLEVEPSNSAAAKEYAAVKDLWEKSLRESQRKAEEAVVTSRGSPQKSPVMVDVKEGTNKSIDSTGSVDRLLSGLSSSGIEKALKPTKTTYFTQKEKQASNGKMTVGRSMEGTKVVVKEGELSSEEEEGGGGGGGEGGGRGGGRGGGGGGRGGGRGGMAEGVDKGASDSRGETSRPCVVRQEVGGTQDGARRGLVPSQEVLRSDSTLEWIQRWNSLSRSAKSKAYADLLKQIPPDTLPKVISNKLDGIMLNKVIDAIRDELMIEGHGLLIVQILQNLAKVPRFDTVLMFLSKDNQTTLQHTVQKLSTRPGLAVSEDTWKKLRDSYKLI